MASPADEAARLRRSAVADIAGGRARRAVQSLTQAINLVSVRCDLPPDEAQQRQRVHHACLLTLAVARLTLDGVAAAHKELEAAHLLTGDDPELAARWHAQHGLILGRSGDLVAAAAELEEATRSLDVFTPQEQCSILINRGMVAFERARPTEAVSLFTTAAEVATEAGLDRQRFMALHNAGYAAYLTGDLPGALARLAAADAIDADVVRAPACSTAAASCMRPGCSTKRSRCSPVRPSHVVVDATTCCAARSCWRRLEFCSSWAIPPLQAVRLGQLIDASCVPERRAGWPVRQQPR